MNRSLLKQNAKLILSNNKYLYGYTFLYFLILVAASFILSFIPIIGWIGNIALSMFMSLLVIGITYQLTNNQIMNINELFGKFTKFIFTYLWYLLYSWPIFVAMFVFVIVFTIATFIGISASFNGPGEFGGLALLSVMLIALIAIVFASIYSIKLYFDYNLSYYVAVDNSANDLVAKDCLQTCKAMMKGHKMDFFVLSLSFIGWFLLTGITFGIAGIYVIPYYQLTIANFYNEIKNDYMNRSRYNY